MPNDEVRILVSNARSNYGFVVQTPEDGLKFKLELEDLIDVETAPEYLKQIHLYFSILADMEVR